MSEITQSPEIDKLATALVSAQAQLKPAAKDSTNPHFKSKYASLQSVWEAAQPCLAKNSLSVLQTFGQSDGDVMHITTTLLHNSGQFIRGTLSIKPQQATPQGIGSAITYGRRYALAAILGIVTDDDDDGNAASERKPEKPEPYKPTGPKITPETNEALNKLCGDAKMATKLQGALDAKGLISFSDLSEADAKKLLNWATK